MRVQRSSGVVDLVARDEEHATALAAQYLSYFQGSVDDWACADQAGLRDVVPVDRLRSYDVREAIDRLFDTGTVLELRREFGVGHDHGARPGRGPTCRGDRQQPGAPGRRDRQRRFRQGGAFHAAVRRPRSSDRDARRHPGDDGRARCRGDRTRAALQPPVRDRCQRDRADGVVGAAKVVRLGCAGDDGWIDEGAAGVHRMADRRVRRHGPRRCGATRLPQRARRMRRSAARDALYRELVDRLYERGKALSIAEYFEIDDVIDPAESRRWITTLLESAPPRDPGVRSRPNIDTW